MDEKFCLQAFIASKHACSNILRDIVGRIHESIKHGLARNYSSQDGAHSILIGNRNLATQQIRNDDPTWTLGEDRILLSLSLPQLRPWCVSIDHVDPVATGDRSLSLPSSSSRLLLVVHCFSGSPYKHGCTKNGG